MSTTAQLSADTAVSGKYAAFDILDAYYKEVNGTPVPLSVLVPKNVKSGRHPVLVRWHGGCLITGHRLYPDWFGDWVLNLALRNNAIIVSPDYRLMPEANGLEILQDLRDFYKWLFTPGNLTASLASGIEPDLENILVSGESAGGWASLQSGILSESKQNVRAIISQYPMIDMRDPHYTAEYEKALFDPPAPQLDHGILRKYMAKMKIGEVITSEIPPSRVPIVISALQQGKWGDWFGGDSSLYPIEMLDKLDIIPPTWILHGKDDNVVPIDGTYKFVGHLKEKQPSARLHTSYRPGGHGFDNHGPASLDEDWLKEGVDFIGQFWPMP